MNKCLRIVVRTNVTEAYIQDVIQKNARTLGLEGTVQVVVPHKEVRIVVCGAKESVDLLLDVVHKGFQGVVPEEVHIEPFLKDKDYRGVFRIIE